jgi:hypothetical protein
MPEEALQALAADLAEAHGLGVCGWLTSMTVVLCVHLNARGVALCLIKGL